MIDIKQIRENPQKFQDACKAKGFAVDIDKLLKTDEQLRDAKKQLQDIEAVAHIADSVCCEDRTLKENVLRAKPLCRLECF